MPTPLHQWVLNWHSILDQFPRGNAIVVATDAIFVGTFSDELISDHDNDNGKRPEPA
ncbi:hypothetical protein OCAR_5570 [Afipia carboxidovorans OM5]|uniref:Uncharacterized protein n=1 Tax=Afipia carboxidovorans (strain ATCC 49405 / DSM 1227 / KCTC 32145 / OM5) TaxID=504832 RepID=B6JEB2_AFIC5|nr:hypothetical protein [Afipia carboxidovorans]ACI92701.1 hypothetical protein OCAR_5570 [Afipia carboxidovorans OM5]AEI03546.1 hypothetical protein OCA4_c24260 [Afipia carboxidovorans OM4]AEI07123.1 hypothetical protein OCA5_c24270 [Afipia carboxidovorans OM5]